MDKRNKEKMDKIAFGKLRKSKYSSINLDKYNENEEKHKAVI